MLKQTNLSMQTRANWLIDTSLFVSGIIAAITCIYFLFLPTGGFRGGRNPLYGITILADRHTWEDWHTWTGIAMIVAAMVHLAIHWAWVKTMCKRALNLLFAQSSPLSNGAKLNLAIDLVVAMSFTLTALSGLYFFFIPAKTVFVFDSVTWDLIHTWSFVALFGGALVHFAIHWRWIVNVSGRLFKRTQQWQRGAICQIAQPGGSK
jgi:hypothetical protein